MNKESGGSHEITRRRFLEMTAGVGLGTVALDACGTVLTPVGGARRSFPRAKGTGKVVSYTFEPAETQVNLAGKMLTTWAYNGKVPGQEVRLNVGDTLRVMVKNQITDGTTVHWHGVPLVNAMDGVDGVTQPAIAPGASFLYEFEVPTAGTYFYHSHVGLQLDRGLYGPLIVEDPKETKAYDQDSVLVLDDWLDGAAGGPGTPDAEMKQLIAGGDTMGGMNDMGGMKTQVPPDVLYPYYLINGKTSSDPFTLTCRQGQRLRLRFINASGASIYRVALQGHRLQVTHADGQAVEPVTVESLRIGNGERYDVIVEANHPGVWQLMAQVEGTQKSTRAVLRYQGSLAAVPSADFQPSELKQGLLTYRLLKAAQGTYMPPGGQADQTVAVALSGGNGQYIWRMNNQVYPKADHLEIPKDRLIRFQFQNQSMMPHPMHLHGHFFQVDNGTGRGPLKDTVLVDPMQKMDVVWVSDNPGLWAFHCHTVYHQMAGMMRVVNVT